MKLFQEFTVVCEGGYKEEVQMPNIYVDMRTLEDSKRRLRKLSGDLENIANSLKSIRNTLDSDIRYSKGIDGSLGELSSQIYEEERILIKSANLLDKAIEDYKSSEQTIKQNLQKIFIDKKVKSTFDVFADQVSIVNVGSSNLFKNNGKGNVSVKSDDGFMNEVLNSLSGGEVPTEAEIAQIDAIMDKYEVMLIENYENISDTDIKKILEDMAKELLPIVNKHRYDFTWWYYAVNTGGIFDVKNSRVVEININGEVKEIKIWNQPWKYDGNEYLGDFAGNFLYGYLGAEVFGTGQLGQAVLKGGAGFAQLLSDRGNPNVNTDPLRKYLDSLASGGWGDNEGDSNQIQLGINSYKSDHGSWKKVIDFEDLLNPFDDLIISMPNLLDPDGILKDEFVEDEPGFIRDMVLIKKIIGSEINFINSEAIPTVVTYINNRIYDLISITEDAINDGVNTVGQAIGDGINAIGDGLERAGDAIGDGIEAAEDAIEDGLNVVGDAIHDLLF